MITNANAYSRPKTHGRGYKESEKDAGAKQKQKKSMTRSSIG